MVKPIKELSSDAIAVGQCLSPVDYRTRKELAELAFGRADNQAVHWVKIAILELAENHNIYRQYTNEEGGKIPVGWSFRFALEGYRRFREQEEFAKLAVKAHAAPTRADCS